MLLSALTGSFTHHFVHSRAYSRLSRPCGRCAQLFLTAILAFLPDELQLRVGITFALSFANVLLLLRPYIRKGDDRLHLFSQAG